MVTQEQIETIQTVVNKVYRKYVFGYFDDDDIKQEAFLIGYEAVQKYWDGIRPLENFLSVHIPNRLKNFKRNNYFRLDVSESNKKRSEMNRNKRNLMEPTELFDKDLVSSNTILDEIVQSEMYEEMYKCMPVFIKSDFKRLINEVRIPKKRKEAVFDFIREFHENW